MRVGRASIALLLTGASLLLGAPPAGSVGGATPDCRAHTLAGRESHRVLFTASCNFEIFRILMRPTSKAAGVWRATRIEGEADPGDKIACRQNRRRTKVICDGRAGAGARVNGRFETEDVVFDCDVKIAFEINGAPECDGEVCPELAVFWNKPARPPRNCTPI